MSIYVTLISLIDYVHKVGFAPQGQEIGQIGPHRVGAPGRMPHRVRKKVWLGPRRVRVPHGARIRKKRKIPPPYLKRNQNKRGRLFVLKEHNTVCTSISFLLHYYWLDVIILVYTMNNLVFRICLEIRHQANKSELKSGVRSS